jgi:hypothetical protein
VEDIFVPEQYSGKIKHYLGDIAIMVSKTIFKFLLTVQPVCIDWTITSDDFLYLKKEFGYVSSMLLIFKSMIFYKSALL